MNLAEAACGVSSPSCATVQGHWPVDHTIVDGREAILAQQWAGVV
jgi:hypothetical protein